MTRNSYKWYSFFLLLLTISLLFLHTILERKVDNTSILLVIILTLGPFIPSIKKIKFGDFEAEITQEEVEKIKKEVTLVPKLPPKGPSIDEYFKAGEDIAQLAQQDYILALAKLRIELEKIIREILLLSNLGPEINTTSVGQMARKLESFTKINPDVIHVTKEIIDVCNRAIHGEKIDKKLAIKIIDLAFEPMGYLLGHLTELRGKNNYETK